MVCPSFKKTKGRLADPFLSGAIALPSFIEPMLSADDVETQFYRALASGDLTLLMACWADDDDVTCVPPGGALLRGAAAIQQLFKDLFDRGAVSLRIREVHRVQGVLHAVHTLVEEVEVTAGDVPAIAHVYATNVYIQTGKGWRLQAHHASPGQLVPNDAAPTAHASPTLH